VAHSGRFSLSLRILAVLAAAPNAMQTSTAIAEELSESAVVIRRHFLLLEKSGFIEQRRGPNGGAKLKAAAQEIGVGDVYLAAEGDWLATSHPSISDLLKQARKDGVLAMNEITLAQVLTRMSKGPASPLKAKRKTPKVAALSQRVNQSKTRVARGNSSLAIRIDRTIRPSLLTANVPSGSHSWR